MATSLLDSLLAYFDQSKNQTEEQKTANAIRIMEGVKSLDALAAAWILLPAPLRTVPAVMAAKAAADDRLKPIDGKSTVISPLIDLLEDKDRSLGVMFGAVQDSVLNIVLDAYSGAGQSMDPELRQQLTATLKPLMTMGMTFASATALAELIMPTKEMGLSNVSHVIYDIAGANLLAAAYTQPIQRAMISAPIEKAVNRLTQQYLPTQGEMTGLARKYEITEEQYRDGMRAWGVKEEYIDALLTGFWADPRLREILLLAQVERPDPEAPQAAIDWLTNAKLDQYIGPDWWFALKFAKAGYDRIDIPVLIKVVRSQFLIKELGDLRVMRRAQYKSGQLSRAAYEEFLRGRGLREEELAPQLDAIEAERVKEQNDETQKLYELQYKNGRIDEATLTAALVDLGLAEERVKSRVEYLTTQKLGKLREDIDSRVPTRADLEQAYKRGAMTKEALIDRLDKMGYTIADAQLIADNAEADLVKEVADEWQRAYEERAKHRRMTIAELEEKMVGLGRSAAYADARSTYILEGIGGEAGTGGAVEVDDATKAVQAESIRAAEQAAKYKRMSIADLKSAYVTAGKTQAWADARAKYIEQLILGKV